MMKLWIVTAVNCNDSSDGKARVLGAFKSRGEAKNYVDEDIKEWIDTYAEHGLDAICDFDKMRARDCDDCDSCEWNIEEVEVQ